MKLGPRGKKIYFLIVSLVFGGVILAMSAIYGRSPLSSSSFQKVRVPFGAETAAYFEHAVYHPAQMLFSDSMAYYIAPPQGATGQGRLYPVLVILPDENGAAPAARYLLNSSLTAFYPAFIVVPVISDKESWAQAGETNVRFGAGRQQRVDLAMQLLRMLMQQIPADPTRVYVLGCGNGATGALRAIKENADLLTAVVAIGGRWHTQDAAALAKIPLWIMQGQFDQWTPARYMQNVAAYVRQAGGDVRFMQVPKVSNNCHDPRLYINAMWSWLFAQQAKGQSPLLRPDMLPAQEEASAH